MTGDPVAPVEAFDGVMGDAHLDLPLDQGIGYRVVVPVDGYVVVDMDPGFLPFGVDIGFCRQRLKRWLVQLLEVLPPAPGQLAEGAVVEFHQQFTDGGIEFQQGEERAVAQRRQDPALDHQYAAFHLGLVPRLANSGRQDRYAVVRGHVLVSGIGIGLVAMGLAHPGSQVVRIM